MYGEEKELVNGEVGSLEAKGGEGGEGKVTYNF